MMMSSPTHEPNTFELSYFSNAEYEECGENVNMTTYPVCDNSHDGFPMKPKLEGDNCVWAQ